MKKILIACEMIEDELNEVINRISKDFDIVWLERGYHDKPEDLNKVVQNAIDKADEAFYDEIMIAYGLCGNGAIGWHANHAVLAMPRFDDCINMMLYTGIRQKRGISKPGEMYITAGWSREKGSILDAYNGYIEKYGECKADKLIRLMYDSYHAVTVIDNGCFEMEPVCKYCSKAAQLLQVGTKEVCGSNIVMEKLLTHDWDENIIVKQPGEKIEARDFEI